MRLTVVCPMRAVCVLIVSAALMACTTAQVPGEPDGLTSEGACDAQAGKSFLGQRAGGESGQQLLLATGARQLRWVPPRTAVTMDFRPDRLSVEYGDDMMITRVSCG